jgi:hypothetical protein
LSRSSNAESVRRRVTPPRRRGESPGSYFVGRAEYRVAVSERGANVFTSVNREAKRTVAGPTANLGWTIL